MGFIDTSEKIPILYNVINAVGLYCPNKRDDTKMVQYLLLHFYNYYPKNVRPKGEMTIDGICGGITKNWIKRFQLDLMFSKKNPISVDGRIDRIRNTQTMKGSITDVPYTLGYLDWLVAHRSPAEYAALPLYVPLANPNNVPPPSIDIVKPKTVPPEIISFPVEVITV